MPKRPIHNLAYLKEHRADLRNNLTAAEAILWNGLKGNALGKKFRRQHSILNYIVDFYCPEEKLIVELDGQHHYSADGLELDFERDEKLMSLGFRIIRVENENVIRNSGDVLAFIAGHFKKGT